MKRVCLKDVAEAAGTISNEILSRLGGRLERIAVEQCRMEQAV